MAKNPASTNLDSSRLAPETLQNLTNMIGSMRGVPEEFSEAFREWADSWSRRNLRKDSICPPQWAIEPRPYSVTELARLPGMPRRTKLHEIIKQLNLRRDQLRNEGGKLTPQVVHAILERVSASRAELKNDDRLTEPFR